MVTLTHLPGIGYSAEAGTLDSAPESSIIGTSNKRMSDMTSSARFRFALLPAIAIFLSCTATPLLADDATAAPRILVSGYGSVSVAPDMAVLSLTVTREADTARAALDANSAAMNAVLEAMKAEGIAPRDLQTSGFSIQPRYFHPPASQAGLREPPRIVGYTVRNNLTVRVRDLDILGAVLDKSVTLGVNEGGNIMFTNAEPSAVIEKARVMAVKQAVSKARTLATAAGVKAGRILEITEQSPGPRPMPMATAELSMARSAGSVPLESGENTYGVTVNLSVAIEP